jgi:hypothetical protein
VLCILHVGKNVRVKLENKIIKSCIFGTLLFYTLISSNTTLRYMFVEGRKDGRTNAGHYFVTPSLCDGRQKGCTGWIYTFIKTRNNRVQTYGWPTLGQTDLRTNRPSDKRTFGLMDLRTNEPSDYRHGTCQHTESVNVYTHDTVYIPITEHLTAFVNIFLWISSVCWNEWLIFLFSLLCLVYLNLARIVDVYLLPSHVYNRRSKRWHERI